MQRSRSRAIRIAVAFAAALAATLVAPGAAPAGAEEPAPAPAPAAAPPPAPEPAVPEDGCYVTPSIFCKRGDHRFDLSLVSRARMEIWEAYTQDTDVFYGLRTRVGARYSYSNLFSFYAEFQDARVWSLSPETSGAGSNYRSAADLDSRTDGQDLRQAFAELRPFEGLTLKGGRMDIHDGTEVMYPEPNWKYLKNARVGQRLLGGVGWTHVERTNDGGSLAYDFGDYHVVGFGGRPTTGVFDADDAYETQDDIGFGGVQFTAKRDAWLPNTENRLFYIGYTDDRPVRDGGVVDGVTVHTVGFSSLGVHPVGPGNLDLLVWFAGQWGDFSTLNHAAAAGILEVGYQLTDVPWKPWVRTGVNIASGDDDSRDGDHHTFFNLLPTNHLYYGYADQFAFQNLIDFLVQLKLQPHANVGVELAYHKFWLQNDDDGRYAGSGAFNRNVFGYSPAIAQPAGTRNAADEIDLVVTWNLHANLTAEAGYAFMWGHGVFDGFADRNVSFGYLQLTAKY